MDLKYCYNLCQGSAYVFLYEFYGFGSYIYVFNPFELVFILFLWYKEMF